MAPAACSALHLPGTGTDHAPMVAVGSRWQEATGSDAPCESNSQEMCWVTFWKREFNAMLIDWGNGLKIVICDTIKTDGLCRIRDCWLGTPGTEDYWGLYTEDAPQIWCCCKNKGPVSHAHIEAESAFETDVSKVATQQDHPSPWKLSKGELVYTPCQMTEELLMRERLW